MTTAGRIVFTRPGQAAHHHTNVDPDGLSEVWEVLSTPICGQDLVARGVIEPGSLVTLIENLIEHRMVLPWRLDGSEPAGSPPSATPARAARPCRHLVLGITGAVQAMFAPHIVDRLASYFAERVDVVLTRAARKFLQPRALSVLGVRVWSDPFEITEPGTVIHMDLATRAELVLVYPATANAIFRLAHGACSDLLSLVVTATRAPVVVVPGMNPSMWQHPATQRNVRQLRDDGVFVVEPGPARSAAEKIEQPTGGPGLGPDAMNLIAVLETALQLSK